MRPDGWCTDPGRAHEVRYLDHDTWTDFVSDDGLVARDPIRRRPRWPWVLGACGIVAVLLLGVLAALGLNQTMDDLAVYSADLTKSADGFPQDSTVGYSRTFVPGGGYRMVVLAPDGVVAGGLISPTVRTVLASRRNATPVRMAAGSEFGVQCWSDNSHGYGMLPATGGGVRLVTGSVPTGSRDTVASGSVTAPRAGVPVRLTLACDVIGSTATLAGYLDDIRVVSARVPNTITEITAGGIVLTTAEDAPATWTVTRFERMGVHNVSAGWRS